MATLPQLIEEDVQQLDETLRDFLTKTEATAALVIDKGGFLIAHQGDDSQFDMTTIGALASGAFMANQTIAGLVSEKNFNSIYQQGEKFSMFVVNVDEHCMLVVIFLSQVGVGVVKFFSANAVKRIADQLAIARDRDPEGGVDLSMLNLADPQAVFRKKTAEPAPEPAPAPPEPTAAVAAAEPEAAVATAEEAEPVEEIHPPRRVGNDIVFQCPACHQPIEAGIEGVGHEFACPGCGERLVVPAVTA